MIASQPSMIDIQIDIGPNPTTNLGSGFPPSSGTPLGSMVMSSIDYPFGRNWNIGVTSQTINLIGGVSPLSGLPYPRGSNVFDGLPFLGALISLGVLPSLEVIMPLEIYLFLGI